MLFATNFSPDIFTLDLSKRLYYIIKGSRIGYIDTILLGVMCDFSKIGDFI